MFDPANMKFPIPTERFECPACESVISNDLVSSKVDETTGHRHVEATCLHCNKTWERTFASVGGVFVPLDQVRQVNDAKRLRGIDRRVRTITGTQLAQSA